MLLIPAVIVPLVLVLVLVLMFVLRLSREFRD